jgi:pyruvate dehydrogenase E1 component
LRHAIVDGAYWLREPGPNCQVIVAYTGAVAPSRRLPIVVAGKEL